MSSFSSQNAFWQNLATNIRALDDDALQSVMKSMTSNDAYTLFCQVQDPGQRRRIVQLFQAMPARIRNFEGVVIRNQIPFVVSRPLARANVFMDTLDDYAHAAHAYARHASMYIRQGRTRSQGHPWPDGVVEGFSLRPHVLNDAVFQRPDSVYARVGGNRQLERVDGEEVMVSGHTFSGRFVSDKDLGSLPDKDLKRVVSLYPDIAVPFGRFAFDPESILYLTYDGRPGTESVFSSERKPLLPPSMLFPNSLRFLTVNLPSGMGKTIDHADYSRTLRQTLSFATPNVVLLNIADNSSIYLYQHLRNYLLDNGGMFLVSFCTDKTINGALVKFASETNNPPSAQESSVVTATRLSREEAENLAYDRVDLVEQLEERHSKITTARGKVGATRAIGTKMLCLDRVRTHKVQAILFSGSVTDMLTVESGLALMHGSSGQYDRVRAFENTGTVSASHVFFRHPFGLPMIVPEIWGSPFLGFSGVRFRLHNCVVGTVSNEPNPDRDELQFSGSPVDQSHVGVASRKLFFEYLDSIDHFQILEVTSLDPQDFLSSANFMINYMRYRIKASREFSFDWDQVRDHVFRNKERLTSADNDLTNLWNENPDLFVGPIVGTLRLDFNNDVETINQFTRQGNELFDSPSYLFQSVEEIEVCGVPESIGADGGGSTYQDFVDVLYSLSPQLDVKNVFCRTTVRIAAEEGY